MPEQWLYNMVIFVQAGEGRGGLASRKVAINHRIDSFEILDDIVGGITADLFPDGSPDLPDHIQPVVAITWTLLTARQGAGVKPLKADEDDHY